MSAPRGIDGIEDIYELTPVQQGLLFHSLYEPRSSVYLEQMLCALRGGVDSTLLQRAFAQVVERHAVLRTAYHWQGFKKSLQVVVKRVDVPWQTIDLRAFNAGEQRRRLEAWLEEDRRRGLRLDAAPLMRCALVVLSDSSSRFVWTLHHLLLDGWSVAIVLEDLCELYDGLAKGRPVERAVPRPYRDYVLWRQQQVENAGAGYWRRYLAGVIAPTRIASRGAVGQVSGKHTDTARRLSKQATAQLTDLARAERTTLSSVVAGALAFVLARRTGQHEVVFGATVSGRPAELEHSERMVGLFINALPQRVRVDARADVWGWLRQVQHDQLEQHRFAHESLVEIQGCSEVARGTPLFETLLVFENYPGLPQLGSDRIEVIDVRAIERTNYPLTLMVTPGDTLHVRASWYDESCPSQSAERLLAHLMATLEAMASGRCRMTDDLPATAPEERGLLDRWSAGPVVIESSTASEEWLVARADQWDELAVAYTGERLTHGQLDTRANALARRLRAAGAGPDVCVGIALGRATALLVAVRAVLKAGAAYVPIDIAHPPERVRWIVRNAGIRLMVCDAPPADGLAEDGVSLVRVGDDEADTPPAHGARPDNLAYAIYTSGSTGFPKGCAVSRRALANLIGWYRECLDTNEPPRALILSSFAFDLTQKNLHAPLLLGGSVHLPAAPFFDGRAICTQIANEQITLVNCTPSAFYPVVEAAAVDDFRPLESLRHLVLGGEPIVRGQLSAWLRSPRCRARVLNSYGPTECADVAVADWLDRAAPASTPVAMGRPIPNTRVRVLDQRMQPVPIGSAGELFIGGIGVGRGYLQRSRDTARRFVPDPFGSEGERLYATGDIVRYDDEGRLEFVGRRDDQIKLRGHRVELGEIEVVMRGHSGVRDVVVAIDQEDRDQPKLVGFIVPSGPHAPDADDLKRHARRWLPDVMIPAAWVVVPRLPLTDRGKIDRQRLLSMSASSAAAAAAASRGEPQTAVELELASIWSQVLGVKQVGTHDNFFDLGGHSLNATLVISRIQQRLRVDLPLRTLFEAPTLSQLASVLTTTLAEKTTTDVPPVTALPRNVPALERRPRTGTPSR